MTKHDAVQLRSYFLWEGDGKPDGHELEYWLRAEAELAKEQTAAKAARAPKAAPAPRAAKGKRKAKAVS
jgi:hypothetical protein